MTSPLPSKTIAVADLGREYDSIRAELDPLLEQVEALEKESSKTLAIGLLMFLKGMRLSFHIPKRLTQSARRRQNLRREAGKRGELRKGDWYL